MNCACGKIHEDDHGPEELMFTNAYKQLILITGTDLVLLSFE
jgi:hypothetical protein